MVHHAEFMDVADSDFLSNNKEFDDDDSEFETVFENYFAFSAAKNRFFGRKRPLHVVLGSGIGNAHMLLLPSLRSTGARHSILLFEIHMLLANLCESFISYLI
jgi:hypothetical protein